VAGDWDGNGTTTVGVVDPGSGTWYVRDHNSAGPPEQGLHESTFHWGLPSWVPVTGDWKATGMTGVGTFDPTNANWYLMDLATDGAAPPPFQYGLPGWIPVAGDWNGIGHTGIGVFDPSTGTWYLRNEANSGPPDAGVFRYGGPGWKPVVGDWDGDGRTTIGVVDPNGVWYPRNENSAGAPDITPFSYGLGGWIPVAANWGFSVTAQALRVTGGAPLAGPDVSGLSPSQPAGVVYGATAGLHETAHLVGRPGQQTPSDGLMPNLVTTAVRRTQVLDQIFATGRATIS
jgi:hypothetical protein